MVLGNLKRKLTPHENKVVVLSAKVLCLRTLCFITVRSKLARALH